MIISKLNIYGYGKWVNQTFEINDQIQLFFGRNESGKSTLQSFIRSILFGFPSKHRRTNQINRFEPKNSDIYGGRLLLEETSLGSVWIERTDKILKITRTDGFEYSEDALGQILGGIDESLFDSFYAFNLRNLQELANVGADQLNDYFLSIGTLGSDKFLQIAKKLEKESDLIYKGKGKKPALNQLFLEYDNLEAQHHKVRANVERYNDLILERDKIDQNIGQINEQIAELEQAIKVKDRLSTRYETYLKLQSIKHELANLQYTEIEDNLPNKIYQADSMIQSLEEENISLEERIDHIHQDLNKLTRLNWTNNHREIRGQWVRETEKIKKTQTQIEQLEERVVEADATLYRIAEKGQFYPEKVSEDDEYKQKVEQGTEIQDQILAINNTINRNQLERKIFLDQRKNIQNQSATMRQNVAILENQRLNEEEQLIQDTRLSQYLFGLTALMMGIGILIYRSLNHLQNSQMIWWIGWLLIGTGIIGCVWIFNKHRRLINDFNNSSIVQRIEEIKFEESQLVENHRQLSLAINEKEKELENQDANLEILENQISDWLVDIGFYPTADPDIILKTNPVKDYFEILHRKNKYIADIDSYRLEVKKWQDSLNEFWERFPYHNMDTRELIEHFEDIELSLKYTEQRGDALNMRLNEAQSSIQRNLEKIQAKRDEIANVFASIGVHNIVEFDQRLNINRQIIDLQEKVTIYEDQIREYADELSQINNKQELITQLNQLERELVIAKGKLEPNLRERANLSVDINFIEQDGTYHEINQSIQNKRAQIIEIAHEWSSRRIAMELIYQTLRHGLDNPVAEMNEIANEIFSLLSNGRYTEIRMNKRNVKVKQFSDIMFEPHELSQGTLEQLYVALRLAFTISAQTMIKMPIIIDDAFVNFDEYRKESMYKVLKKISKTNQILYFTFEQTAMEKFEHNQLINLEQVANVSVYENQGGNHGENN